MKPARVVLFFLALWSTVNAQEPGHGYMKPINRLTKELQFHKALSKGERLLRRKQNDSILLKTLGSLAWRVRNFTKAAGYYSGYDAQSHSAFSFDMHARSLMSLGQYTEARALAQERMQQDTVDEGAREVLHLLDSIPMYFKDSADWLVLPALLDTAIGVYSPMYFGQGLVFVNAGPKTKNKYTTLSWVPDTTVLANKAGGKPVKIKVQKFIRNADKRNNYGPMSLDPVDSTLYFCMTVASRTAKVNRLQLFSARYKNGKVMDVKPFPYNSDKISSFHPAVSPDGRFLYFVSDKPGGNGGLDLYYSTKKPDSSWAEPINIGPLVNSSGNEMFPYVDKNGYLYFSTDGRKGLGALDIFRVKLENGLPVAESVNIGGNRNSGGDDFGIIVDDNGKSGYFSSNRSGTDRLYRFLFSPQPKDTVQPKPGAAVTGALTQGVEGNGKQAIDSQLQHMAAGALNKTLAGADSAIAAVKAGDLSIMQIQGTTDSASTLRYSVFFGKDETTALSPEDVEMYRRAANELMKKEDFVIVLTAYTDYAGTTSVNERVARNRAISVEQFLRSLGVPASKIVVEKFIAGKNILPPSAPGPYDAKREARNRRVDIVVRARDKQQGFSGSTKTKQQPNTTNRNHRLNAQQVDDVAIPAASQAKEIQQRTAVNGRKLPRNKYQEQLASPVIMQPGKVSGESIPTTGSRLPGNAGQERLGSGIANQPGELIPRTGGRTLLDSIRTAEGQRENAPITIETSADSLQVELYDNGVADNDTVSIAYNDVLIVDKKELSVTKPIRFTIAIYPEPKQNKLVLFANNLGMLPPNSGLMIIKGANGWRKEIFIENKLHEASVVFFIKKDKPPGKR